MRNKRNVKSQAAIIKLAKYIAKLMHKSKYDQVTIAKLLSTDEHIYSPSFISMVKTGKTKIPLNLVPKLATILEVNQRKLMGKCLEAYHPEIFSVFDLFGNSSGEMKVIDILRKEVDDTEKAFSSKECKILTTAFQKIELERRMLSSKRA